MIRRTHHIVLSCQFCINMPTNDHNGINNKEKNINNRFAFLEGNQIND